MEVPFYRTRMGHRFFDQVSDLAGKADRLLAALERIASALEMLAERTARDLPSDRQDPTYRDPQPSAGERRSTDDRP